MKQSFLHRSTCPTCGSDKARELCRCPFLSDPIKSYLNDFYGHQGTVEYEWLAGVDYVLNECPRCSLVYQVDIPTPELSERIYDIWIDPEKSLVSRRRNRGPEYVCAASTELAYILRLLGKSPAETEILDYSMGWGEWCRVAQSFGCSVRGTEYSQARREHAEAANLRVVGTHDIPKESIDFIHVEHVLEHLPYPRDTLAELAHLLKPGGLLSCSLPDGSGVEDRIKKWDWHLNSDSKSSMNIVAPLEHINCLRLHTLMAFGQSVGLKAVVCSRPISLFLEPRTGLSGRVRSIVGLALRAVHASFIGLEAGSRELYMLFRR